MSKSVVKEVVEKFVDQACINLEDKMKKIDYGLYTNINFFDYQVLIGEELIKKDITFTTMYDSGFGVIDNDKPRDFELNLEIKCKLSPSYDFLSQSLSNDDKQKIAYKFWSTIIKNDLDVSQSNEFISLLSAFRNLKSFGSSSGFLSEKFEDFINNQNTIGQEQKITYIGFALNFGFFFNPEFLTYHFNSPGCTLDRAMKEDYFKRNKVHRTIFLNSILEGNLNNNNIGGKKFKI